MSGKGGCQQPFSLKERKKIREMLDKNKTGGEIAKVLNRSKTGVNYEVRKNGGREKYDPETAYNNYQIAMREKWDKLRLAPRDHKKNHQRLRLDALEMQVNILKETIQELLNGRKN